MKQMLGCKSRITIAVGVSNITISVQDASSGQNVRKDRRPKQHLNKAANMGRYWNLFSDDKECIFTLTGMAQLVGALFCKPKGCGFDSQSGHISNCRSLVELPMRHNQSIFLSHINVSLPLSLCPFPHL